MIRSGMLCLAASAVLWAQAAPAPVQAEFEVASIKPATRAPIGTDVHVGV
jgi:hypothetical protein